jgi:3-hydroxybutyryl-CoA dehydratase
MTQAKYLEDLHVGESHTRDFHIDVETIEAFAKVSGDFNPIHMDEDFAKNTAFKGRIAHGMLMAAYISASLSSYLPGVGAIYVSQTMKFKRAIRPGDDVTVHLDILDINEKTAHVTLQTNVKCRNKVMVEGQCVILAPKRPVSA